MALITPPPALPTGTYVGQADSVAAPLIVPPAATTKDPAAATWYSTTEVLAIRFQVSRKGTYRYVNFNIGVASGNIQVSLLRLSGAAGTTYTRVVTTGVIACPTAGHQHLDLGATELTPGDYAISIWADNTTITLQHSASDACRAMRMALSDSGGASGIGASGTMSNGYTTRLFAASLEAVLS